MTDDSEKSDELALVPYRGRADGDDSSSISSRSTRKRRKTKSSRHYPRKQSKKQKKDKDRKHEYGDRHRDKRIRSRDRLDKDENDVRSQLSPSITVPNTNIQGAERLRTFESVTKSLADQSTKGVGEIKLLDNNTVTGESAITAHQGIDYLRCIFFDDVGRDIDEPNQELYMLKVTEILHSKIKADKNDVSSWKKLAMISLLDHGRQRHLWKDKSNEEMSNHLERTTGILKAALKENPFNFELNDFWLSCQKADATFEIVQERFRSVINKFLNNADDNDDEFSTKKASYIVAFFRRYIHTLIKIPGSFTYDRIMDVFVEGFSAISSIYGSERRIQRTGPEPAYLFLDMIRFLSKMGYSERSCGLIQAALDINSTTHGRDSCNAMFKTYWESRSNRLGESFPAGYEQWNSQRRQNITKKRRFEIDNSAEYSANIDSQLDFLAIAHRDEGMSKNDPAHHDINHVKRNSGVSLILNILRRSEFTKNANKDEKILFDEIDGGVCSKHSDTLEQIIARSGGLLLPSNVTVTDPGKMRVYSVIHGKSIEVSEADISELSSTSMFRLLLGRLKDKRNDNNFSCIKKNLDSQFSLYPVSENDPFLRWAEYELHEHPLGGIFRLPLRSSHELDKDDFDPSRIVLYEDGIGSIVQKYLSDFDSNGMSVLVLCCLTWLGVSFPRSYLYDENDIRSHVASMYGCGGEDFTEIFDFTEVFNGIFYERAPELEAFDYWTSIYRQLLLDFSCVAFNRSLFCIQNKKQVVFLKNLLYSLVKRNEMNQSISVKGWAPYIQFTLILLEGKISSDLRSAQDVAQKILSATDAAKHDPRLWISYVMIELNHPYQTSTKNALKILTKALSTVKCLSGCNRRGWVEICILLVKLLCKLPTSPSSVSRIRSVVKPENKLKALHIICCAIEGTYIPFSNKECNIKANETLVSMERFEKARLISKKKLLSVDVSESGRIDYFDCTPVWVFDIVLQVWLEILDPSKSELNFTGGSKFLHGWFERMKDSGLPRSKHGIAYLLQLNLELCLLRSSSSNQNYMLQCLRQILTTSLTVQSGKLLTPALLLSLAVFESQTERSSQSYSDILSSKIDSSGNESFYHILVCILEHLTCTKSCKSNENDIFLTLCSDWSMDTISKVRHALFRAVSGEIGSSMPCFWRALIRLELIGGSNASQGGITKSPSRSFLAARKIFEQAISNCVVSKALWLDAFTILRPAFSPEELSRQLLVLEEKGIRVEKSVDDLSIDQ